MAIARAVAKRPQILLCDEPTGALDFRTGVRVLEVIRRVNRELGTTTAVITHNAPVGEMADRVLTLSDGRIQSERRNDEATRAAGAHLVKALTRKLLRDIWHMRGAVFTIALVVAAGIAAFVTLRGTYLSIIDTRDRYYSSERFGDVFAQLERAPNALADKLEPRCPASRASTPAWSGSARVPLETTCDEPAQARVISHPRGRRRRRSTACACCSGRMPSSDRDDEAVLIEMFAEKHGVRPGDTLRVVIEGRERVLRVVGIGDVARVRAGRPERRRRSRARALRRAVDAAPGRRGRLRHARRVQQRGARPGARRRARPLLPQARQLLDRYGGARRPARARARSRTTS